MVMLNKSEFKLVVLRLMQNLSEELNLYSCHYFCDRLWIFHLKKSFVIQAYKNTELTVTQCGEELKIAEIVSEEQHGTICMSDHLSNVYY